IIEVLQTTKGNGTYRGVYTMLISFFTSVTEEPTRYRDDNPVRAIGKRFKPSTGLDSSGAISEQAVVSAEEIEAIADLVGQPSSSRVDSEILACQLEFLVRLMPRVGGRIGEMLGLHLNDWNTFAKPYGEIIFRRTQNKHLVLNDEQTWWGPLKGKT